jgi:hypothetical protein
MDLEPDTLLLASPEELSELLRGQDLREWLQVTLAHQLEYQRELAIPGTFELEHPALSLDQYARLRALGYAGPNMLPEILAVLVHPETAGSNPVVWALCEALARMGAAGAEATAPLLQRLLRDGITEYPSRVVGALEAVAPDRDAIVASLMAVLADEEEQAHTVVAALYALPAFQAVQAVPRILELTRSQDAEVRSHAALALGQLGGGEQSERCLLALTEDPEWFVRGNAIDSLGQLDCGQPEVLAAALHILEEDDNTPDWSAPECAARTLRRFGGYTDQLKARLLRGEPSTGLAEECVAALREAGVSGWEDRLPEELRYLLEDDDDNPYEE